MPINNLIKLKKNLHILLWVLLLSACKEEAMEVPSIVLSGKSIDGIAFVDGTINVAQDATIELLFSAAIDPVSFETALSITNGVENIAKTISYTHASSKAVIIPDLEFDETYLLTINKEVIGTNGQVLDRAWSLEFSTVNGGIITQMAPCLSASENCLESAGFTSSQGINFTFDHYSSFPIYEDNARWESLKNAVIVVHGQNRNADDYFNYMSSSLRNQSLEETTVLISPFFKNSADTSADDLYWSSSNWREGQPSSNDGQSVSSFEVIDLIIDQLADVNHFPVLENILITGHSSGALFTHVYTAGNKSIAKYPSIHFFFGVANSQYFYYPDDVRYNTASATFTEPSACSDYNHWPLGFINPAAYTNDRNKATIDQQLIDAHLTYFLGTNDVSTTGTLNTADCSAVLLGEHRLDRGERMHQFVQTFYSNNNHQKTLVNNVGHNAQSMYSSAVFMDYLSAVFN